VDKVVTPTMVNYAYPVMLMGVVGMINEMFSRLTLKWWLPKDFYEAKTPAHALGVFAACYKFSVLMSIAIQAFRFAAEPFFFSNAADKNSPGLFSKVNHYFVIGLLVFGCVLQFLSVVQSHRQNLFWYNHHGGGCRADHPVELPVDPCCRIYRQQLGSPDRLCLHGPGVLCPWAEILSHPLSHPGRFLLRFGHLLVDFFDFRNNGGESLAEHRVSPGNNPTFHCSNLHY